MLNSVLLVQLLILLTLSKVDAHDLNHLASDFSRHSIVHPVVLHGRTKREISTTRDTNEAHHPEIMMKFPIDGEEYIFDLRLNDDLLTDNHILSYHDNGKTVLHQPKREELHLCHYSGSVRDKPGSWVAVSTCHGVQGIVFDGERMRYIEPAQDGELSSQHYVYDHSDLIDSQLRGYVSNEVQTGSGFRRSQKRRMSRFKRSIDSKIHEPYNANEESRYVELVLVANSGVYKANRHDRIAVHRQMMTIANIINSLYSPLNIFIALVGVEVWITDKILLSNKINVTLENFARYKQSALLRNIPHDNAHLLIQGPIDKTAVGLGYVSPYTICSDLHSCGIASNHTKILSLLAMTVAHEMGHNLGMHHDVKENCTCQTKSCIMNPWSTLTTHWSSCSLKSLKETFLAGSDYCLRNKPKSLATPSMCGNGFVEPGEQCDCGTMAVAGANNPCHACCDPNTCMLRANATCGAGMCCDLQTCRYKSQGTICRAATQECDLPEHCNGRSEDCPEDVYKMDTTRCRGPGMMCRNKECVFGTGHTRVCPTSCSGRGVCNSKGHCHCNVGYAPPSCATPGPGGSEDSGPASDTTSSLTFMIVMYAIFLGIVPVLLVLLLIYNFRHNVMQRYKSFQRRLSVKPQSNPPVTTINNDRVLRAAPPIPGNNSGGSSPAELINANYENVHRKFSNPNVSLPTQNKKLSPPKPHRNINKNITLTYSRDSKVTLPESMKSRDRVLYNNEANIIPLVKTKLNTNSLSNDNGRSKVKPLVKAKPNVNKLSNDNEIQVKPTDRIKLMPNINNLNTTQFSNENESNKDKPLVKPKPNANNLSIENSLKVKPPVVSKPNANNLSNKNRPQAPKFKPPTKPKPNVNDLPCENEPKPSTIKDLIATMNNQHSMYNIGHNGPQHNVNEHKKKLQRDETR